MPLDIPLLPHQEDGITWIHGARRGLLGDEPGLGKSRTAIEAFDGMKTLVVAPSMVIAGGTWRDELEKWAERPDLFTVVPYSYLNARVKTTGSGTKPVNRLRDDLITDWDAIIVDEAHYTKGRKTMWTLAVAKLAKRAEFVLEMTGTPMPNWAHELFTILQVLYPLDARPGGKFGSHDRWVKTWFDTTKSLYGGDHSIDIGGLKACYPECMERSRFDPCEHYHRFVRDNLGDRFLRRLRDDVLAELPPSTTQVVEVPMDTSQRKHYNALRKEFLTVTDAGTEVVAWSSGTKNVLLDRITTSGWFLDMEGEPRGGKLEQLRFDLEGRSRPTLVVAHYRDTVDACVQVAQSVGASAAAIHGGISKKDAARDIERFKAGNLDVLVGSLETISEGLTLTAADMVIFVEKSFKPSRNDQAEKRIHRMGQTRPVTVRDYVTPKSVDSKKRVLLDTKTDQQMRVLTAAQFRDLL